MFATAPPFVSGTHEHNKVPCKMFVNEPILLLLFLFSMNKPIGVINTLWKLNKSVKIRAQSFVCFFFSFFAFHNVCCFHSFRMSDGYKDILLYIWNVYSLRFSPFSFHLCPFFHFYPQNYFIYAKRVFSIQFYSTNWNLCLLLLLDRICNNHFSLLVFWLLFNFSVLIQQKIFM